MRAAVDLEKLGSRTLMIDCDVLRADGGTRTTAITGAYVAVARAVRVLMDQGLIKESPLKAQIAAVSVGIVGGEVLVDLNYEEDKDASVDMNIVMTASGQYVEVQAAGEESTFSPDQLAAMLAGASRGLRQLFDFQEAAIAQ